MNDTVDMRFAEPPRLLTEDEFVGRFGAVYEHSPWVAAETWRNGIDARHDTVDGLAETMARTLDAASEPQKRALINSHPDLAGRAAVRGELTADSTAEQASAGIDQCSAEEFERFQSLNAAYRERFGFTFIMAVKGSNRHAILNAFEERLRHDLDEEFAQAIVEIHKIAGFRLLDIAATLASEKKSTLGTSAVKRDRNPFLQWIDLAQPRLGSEVVYATDDFFADKSRMIAPQEPVWVADKFDDNGKWMDGWESRRKRGDGHDYAIVRLGVPGTLHGANVDTRHFTGNFPPEASLDACVSAAVIPDDATRWDNVIARVGLSGDSQHFIAIDSDREYTHVRLNIFPDGGVARLRLYGEIRPDWQKVGADERIDLVALVNGGRAIICNDEHFGSMLNLNAPGDGVNMGDGWETARRREAGNDWVILALGHIGTIEKIIIDTAYFKGNYPDKASIQAVATATTYPPDLATQSIDWPTLLPAVSLSMDQKHEFVDDVRDIGPITHVKINIFPDGGLSRVRLIGRVARDSS